MFNNVWIRFKEKHPTVAQFLVFFILSNGITVFQLVLMPLLRVLFAGSPLEAIPFQVFPVGSNLDGSRYYIFNYAAGPLAPDGSCGGLAYFLAVQITLAIAQIINFIFHYGDKDHVIPPFSVFTFSIRPFPACF